LFEDDHVLTVNVEVNICGFYSWSCVDGWRDGTSVSRIRFHGTRFYSQCTSLAITAGFVWSWAWNKVWSRGEARPCDGHSLTDTSDLTWYDCFRIDFNFFADCFDRWRQENFLVLTISRSACDAWSLEKPIQILEVMKKGHLFVFNGQTTSDLLSPKWILTKCIEFDGCLWCSWGCVLSWGYHASVHFIILRASNSQSGSLGLVLFECSFNGTGYHFITLFPCYGCFFSFQTRDFTGDSGACADKCIFAYCFDTWKILIMSKLNLDNRIKHNMFIGEIQCPEMKSSLW